MITIIFVTQGGNHGEQERQVIQVTDCENLSPILPPPGEPVLQYSKEIFLARSNILNEMVAHFKDPDILCIPTSHLQIPASHLCLWQIITSQKWVGEMAFTCDIEPVLEGILNFSHNWSCRKKCPPLGMIIKKINGQGLLEL